MNPTRLPAVFPPEPTPEEIAAHEAARKVEREEWLKRSSDDDLPCSAGWRGYDPLTPEEIAEFEAAKRASEERFLKAALADDGMPVSAGWRGPASKATTAPTPPASAADQPSGEAGSELSERAAG